jgi:stage II sporulation protein E
MYTFIEVLKMDYFFRYSKNKWVKVLKVLLLIIIQYLLSSAKLLNGVMPFKFGLPFALVFMCKNLYEISAIYFISSLLSSLSIQGLIISSCEVLFLLLIGVFYELIKKKINIVSLSVFSVLSQTAYIYYNCYNNNKIIATIVSIIIGEVFLFCCINLVKMVITTLGFKMSVDSIISIGMFVVGVVCGLNGISVYEVNLGIIICLLFILVNTFVLPLNYSLFLSIMMGLGCAVQSGEVVNLAMFPLMALICYLFKGKYKVYSLISLISVEILFMFYLNTYELFNVYSLIEIAVSSILFYLIPTKQLYKLELMMNKEKNRISTRSMINRSRLMVSKKLCYMSDVFNEMNCVFRKMIKGNLPLDDAKNMLCNELAENICENCSEKGNCLRINGAMTKQIFFDLFTAGFDRGKATVIDLPSYITGKCKFVNELLNEANTLISQYKHYSNMVQNLDSSRILIAEELEGISKIMRMLSSQINTNLSFDVEKENDLINELNYYSIICLEVMIYCKDEKMIEASVVVRNEDSQNELIQKCLEKTCKQKMIKTSCSFAFEAGFSLIEFKSAPIYNIIFGYSAQSKSNQEISGDNYSLLKIDDSKYLMALCDGMGNGEKANKTSDLAINLIENFYKAGFDNEIILSCVNKLLSLNNEDNFTALDIGVIDLRKNFADFVKLGAPYGFIKHSDSVSIINGGALPIGILDEVKPEISKMTITNNDMVIMMTDGITEAFGDKQSLSDFINNLKCVSPQEVADSILEKATKYNGGFAKDDMTILVGKVFFNV